MKKKVLFVISGLIVVLLLGMGFVFHQTLQASNEMKFTQVSLSEIKDGTYFGSASAGIVKAEVKVHVNNHKIINIELCKHEQGMGKKAEVILEQMIQQNTTQVDAISGATVSSHVLRKAVEQALINQIHAE